jgi:hypothetical protein
VGDHRRAAGGRFLLPGVILTDPNRSQLTLACESDPSVTLASVMQASLTPATLAQLSPRAA